MRRLLPPIAVWLCGHRAAAICFCTTAIREARSIGPIKSLSKNNKFLSGDPLVKPELYASMILNPEDNREHLPEDYITDILDALPEKQRARFRDGA